MDIENNINHEEHDECGTCNFLHITLKRTILEELETESTDEPLLVAFVHMSLPDLPFSMNHFQEAVNCLEESGLIDIADPDEMPVYSLKTKATAVLSGLGL